MTQMVHIVMKIAPIGVFALIAAVVGQFGAQILLILLKYALVVLAGLAIHMGTIYSLAVWIFARMNPLFFFRGMRPAQLIAFSTSSSNATLPVNIQCAEENLGVPKDIASFVLPLGATINMDGTALYQGVAAVFIAQVYGIPLTDRRPAHDRAHGDARLDRHGRRAERRDHHAHDGAPDGRASARGDRPHPRRRPDPRHVPDDREHHRGRIGRRHRRRGEGRSSRERCRQTRGARNDGERTEPDV